MLDYFLIFVFLLITELIYFWLARKYNILDVPNERSLHNHFTIRGGGIVFLVASGIFFFQSDYLYKFFFIGLLIISFISFIDDVRGVSSKIRLILQFCAISFFLYQIQVSFTTLEYWVLPVGGIVAVGIINAYNFMDGINGLTGLYSFSMLLTMVFINNSILEFVENNFLILPMISIVVFLIFNLRRKAICFSGDVGSIGIAFTLVFFTTKLILKTNDWKYLFLFTCYGIDTIYTLIYRIQQKQNILEAHKLHFFQILTYKYNKTHLQISTLYAISQIILNYWINTHSMNTISFYIPMIFLLILVHMIRNRNNLGISIKLVKYMESP